MSLIDRLRGKGEDKKTVEEAKSTFYDNKKVADDPVLFADWVNKYLVLGQSYEDDLGLAPDEEQCKELEISNKERCLCANEYVLLRALGACMFVRNNLDEKYYLTFRDSLLPQVIERMERNSSHMHHDNPSEALEQYLDDLKSDTQVSFSMTYLERVYPDTPRSDAIYMNGIPVLIGLKHAIDIFNLTQEGFCKLKFNVGYETIEKIYKLNNNTKKID